MGAHVLFWYVSSGIPKKSPVYLFHRCLAKQRDSCGLSLIPRDDKHASVPLSLPTHLPLAPSADVRPNVSPTDGGSDHSLATAWLWTDWTAAYLNHFELGCPKIHISI